MPTHNKTTPVPAGATDSKKRRSRFMVKTGTATQQFPESSAKGGTRAYKEQIKKRLAKTSSTSAEEAERKRAIARKRGIEGKGTQQGVHKAMTKKGSAIQLNKMGESTQSTQDRVKVTEAAASTTRKDVGRRQKDISEKVMRALKKKKG